MAQPPRQIANRGTFVDASCAGLQPLPERPGQRRQVEEEVLGLDELRHLAVDPGPRVLQVDRVELAAAVVALVAPGAVNRRSGRCPRCSGRQRPSGGGRDGTICRSATR